ncbi:hypothetical protein Tsubulata_040103 [Turnera subulata]|uniref:Uncharacterized protein n=1 Tax=Turnera subulata TaxID=218843 RepID=A0A9Q0FMI5_9ROSI|nr:hypothetical protein Tsubulata_040103 [Turnera subulata]
MTEVEANHNSPVFLNRFIETFFFFGSYFDCLDARMKRDDPNRIAAEAIFFGQGTKSVLATNGEERTMRNVKIDVWRSYFARFGMVEAELSTASLYHADLVAKKFS